MEKKKLRKTVRAPNHLWETCENFAITGFTDRNGAKISLTLARNVAEPGSGDEETSSVYRYHFATLNLSPDVAKRLADALLAAAQSFEANTAAEDVSVTTVSQSDANGDAE